MLFNDDIKMYSCDTGHATFLEDPENTIPIVTEFLQKKLSSSLSNHIADSINSGITSAFNPMHESFPETVIVETRNKEDIKVFLEKVFYLNITLLNKNEIVEEKVQEKLHDMKDRPVGKLISRAATALTSESYVSNKIYLKLSEMMQERLQEMGLKVTVSKMFLEGSFFVLKADIQTLELYKLVEMTKGKEYATNLKLLVSSLQEMGVKEKTLPNIMENISMQVYEALLCRLSQQLPSKFSESGIKAKVVALHSSHQAEYFFDAISKNL